MSGVTKQSALITGANKGIGLEIARQLGRRDFAVWLGCRDRGRGEAAVDSLCQEGIEAYWLPLEVTDTRSIQVAVELLANQTTALDALVNNAGVSSLSFGGMRTPSEESVENMRAIFDVNTFGPVRVTQAFLPLLRKSAAARIVMCSSGLGSIAATLDMTQRELGHQRGRILRVQNRAQYVHSQIRQGVGSARHQS